MRRLLDALSSGAYPEGTEYLRDSRDRYNAMGVLCDLSGLGRWERHGGCHAYVVGDVPNWTMAPDEVLEASGVDEDALSGTHRQAIEHLETLWNGR